MGRASSKTHRGGCSLGSGGSILTPPAAAGGGGALAQAADDEPPGGAAVASPRPDKGVDELESLLTVTVGSDTDICRVFVWPLSCKLRLISTPARLTEILVVDIHCRPYRAIRRAPPASA